MTLFAEVQRGFSIPARSDSARPSLTQGGSLGADRRVLAVAGVDDGVVGQGEQLARIDASKVVGR